jgi:alkylation response protein AidB-like acyl-CoA dehydrogenase
LAWNLPPVPSFDELVSNVIGPVAPAVDAEARFPRESIDALGKAGFLGLMRAPEIGGGGGSLADAVEVVSAITSVCGSTAMVMTMHYLDGRRAAIAGDTAG